jgi:hypothetical protein
MQRLQKQAAHVRPVPYHAGIIGGLALVALLAAAFIFYKSIKRSKEDGFKTIARRVLATGHLC